MPMDWPAPRLTPHRVSSVRMIAAGQELATTQTAPAPASHTEWATIAHPRTAQPSSTLFAQSAPSRGALVARAATMSMRTGEVRSASRACNMTRGVRGAERLELLFIFLEYGCIRINGVP